MDKWKWDIFSHFLGTNFRLAIWPWLHNFNLHCSNWAGTCHVVFLKRSAQHIYRTQTPNFIYQCRAPYPSHYQTNLTVIHANVIAVDRNLQLSHNLSGKRGKEWEGHRFEFLLNSSLEELVEERKSEIPYYRKLIMYYISSRRDL